MSYEEISHLIPGIRRYADEHIETGGFLRAFLENNLIKACVRSDPTIRPHFTTILLYLIEETPRESWGSPERVKAWLALRNADNSQPATTEVQP